MATYKVIQDIEAEDHIIGPLTLRQFIFALISVFCFYICFLLLTKGVGFLMILFLPPALFFGFFAIPFGRDQSTEVWALAKLRFWFKSRKRIWDQSGVKQLVTITVPKKIERALTDGLSETEVNSRLKGLANTLDSRGWAVKNAGLTSATFLPGTMAQSSDRLIDVGTLVSSVPDDNAADEPDILDENQSIVAKHFNQMIDESSVQHRQALINQMNTPTAPTSSSTSSPTDNQWFMPQANESGPAKSVYAPDVAAQDETSEEAEFVSKIKSEQKMQKAFSSNLRTLQPINNQPQTIASLPDSALKKTGSPALTGRPDPAILSLANNNDFNVDTLAREAKRSKGEEPDQKEVVISLH